MCVQSSDSTATQSETIQSSEGNKKKKNEEEKTKTAKKIQKKI